MNPVSNDILAQALQVGAAQADIKKIENAFFALVPPGYSITNLEHLMNKPTRKKGKPSFRDAASFTRFVNEHKDDASRIYYTSSLDALAFTCVFNEHVPSDLGDTPNWRDFLATYSCPFSPEWKAWNKSDGAKMTQESFAAFIEDNLIDIREPAAADMLEISRTLEAKKKVDFSSGIRLSDGQTELSYIEDLSGTTKGGKLQIPENFLIGIPVFEGGPIYGVTPGCAIALTGQS